MITKNGLFRFLGRSGCGCIGDTSTGDRGSPTAPLSADVTSPGRSVLCPQSHILAPYKPGHPQKAEGQGGHEPGDGVIRGKGGGLCALLRRDRQDFQAFSSFLMHQNHLGCLFKLRIPVNPIPRFVEIPIH